MFGSKVCPQSVETLSCLPHGQEVWKVGSAGAAGFHVLLDRNGFCWIFENTIDDIARQKRIKSCEQGRTKYCHCGAQNVRGPFETTTVDVVPLVSKKKSKDMNKVSSSTDIVKQRTMEPLAQKLAAGTKVILLGNPGAGKSTLLNSMMLRKEAAGNISAALKEGAPFKIIFVIMTSSGRVISDVVSMNLVLDAIPTMCANQYGIKLQQT